MAFPRRVARLQKLILEVAAETVQRRLRDPRLGFVTLTRVKLAPDLTEATIYWSCLGTENERKTSGRALEDAAPFVQGIVGRAIRTRVTPRLRFVHDTSLVQAAKLEGIFEAIRKERGEPVEEPAVPAAKDEPEGAEASGAEPPTEGADGDDEAADAEGTDAETGGDDPDR